MTEPSVQRLPRPEHPRPDFHRGLRSGVDWLNLNGSWDFEFDPADEGLSQAWHQVGERQFSRTILVPFPWESHLAWGTQRQAGNADWFSPQAYLDPASVSVENYRDAPRHTIGWYQRSLRVPDAWRGRRVFLNFGAVDWHVQAWVNGEPVGEAESGYLPVSFEVTRALTWEQEELVVRVFDAQDHSRQPVGKQHNWYTRTSGIWQTVWLEPRGAGYIAEILVRPSLADSAVDVEFIVLPPEGSPDVEIEAFIPPERSIGVVTTTRESLPSTGGVVALHVDLPEAIPWTPEAPHLYRLTATLKCEGEPLDQVTTQFGLRDISVCPLCKGGPSYICLNGEPVHLRGALDQSFHPQGVYTFPTDEALKADLRAAQAAGFNFLRLHIKAEDPRFYYWADRLGVLLMCDIPNFGYDGYSDEARGRWERTAEGIIRRDLNHPSIISWCLFNETWGLGGRDYKDSPHRQAWVKESYKAAKRLDPTRLIEDNSACLYDHVATDINSWHFYLNDHEKARDHIAEVVENTRPGSAFNFVGGNVQGNEPLLNSEYGGISARAGDLDVSWCFRFLTNELRKHESICGYVYTELSDIEWECNGILNYDRSPKEFGYDPALLQYRQFIGFDCPPGQTVAPGEPVRIPVFLRPSREAPVIRTRVTWTATFVDSLGHHRTLVRRSPLAEAEADRALIELMMPDEPGLVRVQADLTDGQGRLVAMNFCYLSLRAGGLPSLSADLSPAALAKAGPPALPVGRASSPPAEVGTVVLRRQAGDALAEFDGECERGEVDGQVQLFGAQGSGWLEYAFELPADLPVERVEAVTAVFEASSKRPGAPQTDADTWPSVLEVSLNGVSAAKVVLRDQPADSRGVLSHMHGFQGRYGELLNVRVSGEALAQTLEHEGTIRLRLCCEEPVGHGGGLTVYGSRAGRYPCDVHLVIATRPQG